MSQISHLLSLSIENARAILFTRKQEIPTFMPRDEKMSWSSSDSYCNPYKKIPNCRAFKIKLGIFDPLFLLIGITKKVRPEIEIEPYTNRHINRYILYQVKRLNKMRDEGRATEFWELGYNLIANSDAFMVMAVNHVFPQWQRHQNLSSVISWCQKAKKIHKDLRENYGWQARINFARRYIEKQDGSWRPLGVPTPAWRIALHMWAQLFSIWTHTWMPKSQHGFVSGRGTLTAWREILSKIKEVNHIYEYDLKDCFNKIRLDALSDIMGRELQIPAWIVNKFSQLNMSTPRFGTTTKIDESQYQERSLWHKDPRQRFGVGFADSRSFPEQVKIREMIKARIRVPDVDPILDVNWGPPIPVLRVKSSNATNEMWGAYYSTDRDIDRFKPILTPKVKGRWNPTHHLNQSTGDFIHPDEDVSVFDRNNQVGVPQGAATSPIFANIVIKKLYDMLQDLVGYADDAIRMQKVFDHMKIDFPHLGLFEKPGGQYVKLNGKWLKPLKFLGLVYDPFTDTLRSDTKKGAKLEMKLDNAGINLETIMKEHDLRYGKYHNPNAKSWEMMIKSHLAGWIQSRLYSGFWQLDKFFQDFTYTFASASWSKKLGKKVDPSTEVGIFNSSSIASAWLIARLAGGSNSSKVRTIFGPKVKRLKGSGTHKVKIGF
jgi:hypothetical protein